MAIQKPKYKFQVFGEKAQDARYLPVKFATGQLITKTDWFKIANDNFSHGLESLEGDVQLRDFNSVLYYLSSALGYLFQQGVAEWSMYQEYPAGALASYEGKVYIAKEHIFGKSLPKVIETDACGNPLVDCSLIEEDSDPCGRLIQPNVSKQWCALVDKCEYDTKIKELEKIDKELNDTVRNLKGVEGFAFNADTGNFEITLSDGSVVTAKHTASIELKNFDGSISVGYIHSTTQGN